MNDAVTYSCGVVQRCTGGGPARAPGVAELKGFG